MRHTLFQTAPFVPITQGMTQGPPLLLNAITSANLGQFLEQAFYISISVGAILAVLRIGYAGFKYMTTDAAGGKSDAKKIISDAVIGLLLLLAIVLILQRINPNLLRLNFIGGAGGAAPAQQTSGPFPGQ